MSSGETRAHDSSEEDNFVLSNEEGDEEEEQLFQHEARGDEVLCPCEQMYQDSGNEKKVLYLMSIGLNGDNGPLFSLEQEPWSLLPKNALRPKNNEYVKEITRRSKLYNIQPIPRPSNWTRQQIMEWLERNPIHEVEDIAFLSKEVRRVRDVLIRAVSAPEGNYRADAVATNAVGSIRNWRGPVPYLRIIMCLTRDHVKSLFLDRANSRSRLEIDARNNENRYVKGGMFLLCLLVFLVLALHVTTLLTLPMLYQQHRRPQTVFEVISDMWNSPDFNPVAPASECHSDFQSATICSYEQVEGLCPATPQRIEDVFTSMRSDLLRIITRWEQSGQGEGGMDAEDEHQYDPAGVDNETTLTCDPDQDSTSQDCIGVLEGRPARALQSRASFLNG